MCSTHTAKHIEVNKIWWEMIQFSSCVYLTECPTVNLGVSPILSNPYKSQKVKTEVKPSCQHLLSLLPDTSLSQPIPLPFLLSVSLCLSSFSPHNLNRLLFRTHNKPGDIKVSPAKNYFLEERGKNTIWWKNMATAPKMHSSRVCRVLIYIIGDADCWWAVSYWGEEQDQEAEEWGCDTEGAMGVEGRRVRGSTANGLEKNMLVFWSWRCFDNG